MQTQKPRLLFIRPIRANLPGYIVAQLQQQVRCLELFFDVSVVGGHCDFDRECSRFEPHLVVFESGAYAGDRKILNARSHPGLPRLGFLNADAYCLTRSVFIADMDRWGVNDFFTLSVSMAEYFPAIADRMFVWANCIDRSIFTGSSDEKSKNISVLFTGNHALHYPWRIRIHDVIAGHYPTLVVPRPSWWQQHAYMPQGADYAKLIGASWFAPACGTIANEVVRKHFEIPAAGACLLAEPTTSLKEAGFVDMENCVFADKHSVVDKVDYLFRRTDELEQIIDAGQTMVLERHSMECRSQVAQWYQLSQFADASSRIVQDGPFGDLRLVPSSSGIRTRHVISGGVDRALLRQAVCAMQADRLGDAESLFLRCLNYHPMPEATLGMAKVAMKSGDPALAENWLTKSIYHAIEAHGATSPDPVEWAYWVRAALCRGDAELAAERIRGYPELNHPEIAGMRQVLDLLHSTLAPVGENSRSTRPSVHDGEPLSATRWTDELCSDLRRCGQGDSAHRILSQSSKISALSKQCLEPYPSRATGMVRHAPVPVRSLIRRLSIVPAVVERRWRSLARRIIRRSQFGEFFQELTALAMRMDVHSAVICGADPTGMLMSALARGAAVNPGGPLVLAFATHAAELGTYISVHPSSELAESASGQTACHLSLVVAATHCDLGAEWFKRYNPNFVAIEQTHRPIGSDILRFLVQSYQYSLLRSGTDRAGYVILRRSTKPIQHQTDATLVNDDKCGSPEFDGGGTSVSEWTGPGGNESCQR
jgi:hypothetical protein